jgi:hypothetical protein
MANYRVYFFDGTLAYVSANSKRMAKAKACVQERKKPENIVQCICYSGTPKRHKGYRRKQRGKSTASQWRGSPYT